jgi:hypothetical protein
MGDGSEALSIDALMLNMVSRMGAMEQAIRQAPTHEKLGLMFNEVRRDFGERFTSSEGHVRTLIEKYESDNQQRTTANNVQMQGWASSAAKAAAKEALAEQRQIEAEARAAVQKSDEDLERRIRTANARSWGSVIIAVAGVGYGVAKGQGWIP